MSNRSRVLAIGRGEEVVRFARAIGAEHLMFQLNWRTALMEAISSRASFAILLDGSVSDGILERGKSYDAGRILDIASGRYPSAFDWEVWMVWTSRANLSIEFHLNGEVFRDFLQ